MGVAIAVARMEAIRDLRCMALDGGRFFGYFWAFLGWGFIGLNFDADWRGVVGVCAAIEIGSGDSSLRGRSLGMGECKLL